MALYVSDSKQCVCTAVTLVDSYVASMHLDWEGKAKASGGQ